ncbi:MAG TPA: hypothetical protein ENL06_03250 [Candidatus Portnoybacteria bacterium]|nr:hypothetical protein [Candidatus Portnoybacteria bacterium]
MKICITSNGPNLDSSVDPRFGRCLYFIFVNDENLEKIRAISNEGVNAVRGAGVQSAQTVIDQNADVVITGNVGPNSLMVLNGSKIKIFQAVAGSKVKDALASFEQNQLLEITQSVEPGFGSFGRGRGMGQGKRRR